MTTTGLPHCPYCAGAFVLGIHNGVLEMYQCADGHRIIVKRTTSTAAKEEADAATD